ncbi:hypothetical protein MCOR10_011676 [Pyricularia oryzae]|nr:hypothetical protein MCOR10_011676 [Pyricularia oryzae]
MAATARKAGYKVELNIYENLGYRYKIPDEFGDLGIPDDDRSSLQGSMIFSNALSLTHPDIQAGRRMASTYSQ